MEMGCVKWMKVVNALIKVQMEIIVKEIRIGGCLILERLFIPI